jgi:uncharacterized protein YciI
MKFAAIIEYGHDKEKIQSLHQAHREYLRRFLENGQLRALDRLPMTREPFGCSTRRTQAVDEIVKGDPYVAAGVIASWKIRPFAYWSAQEAKGAR